MWQGFIKLWVAWEPWEGWIAFCLLGSSMQNLAGMAGSKQGKDTSSILGKLWSPFHRFLWMQNIYMASKREGTHLWKKNPWRAMWLKDTHSEFPHPQEWPGVGMFPAMTAQQDTKDYYGSLWTLTLLPACHPWSREGQSGLFKSCVSLESYPNSCLHLLEHRRSPGSTSAPFEQDGGGAQVRSDLTEMCVRRWVYLTVLLGCSCSSRDGSGDRT